VARAVGDLRTEGRRTALAREGSPPRAAVTAAAGDSELRAVEPFGGRRGEGITEREHRLILDTMLSPVTTAQAVGMPTAPTAPAPRPEAVAPPMRGVVVGRRPAYRLELVMVPRTLT